MRFDYRAWIGFSTDTGEPIAFFRPVVTLKVYGPQGFASHDALVDTGADTCIFPRKVAVALGIHEEPTKGPDATAYGGELLPATFADIEVELSDGETTLKWPLLAYFHETADDGDDTLILGHTGFLEFFITTFIGEDFALELSPNDYLPTLSEDTL